MDNTRFHMNDLPPELLDFFTIKDGVLCWVDEPPWRRSVNFRSRRVPFGEPCGSRNVIGRGKLVSFARCYLLSNDIVYALEHGGEWPWQRGDDAGIYDGSLEPYKTAIYERFSLYGDKVVWRHDRGYNMTNGLAQYPAGSPVAGFALSGYRGRMVTTSNTGFLLSDIANVLKVGAFPFEWN